MNIKLDVNEYAFLITAVNQTTIKGENAHFVSSMLKKLENNYNKIMTPPPLQK